MKDGGRRESTIKQQSTKVDLRAQLRWLYQPSAKKIEVVDVPMLSFLIKFMIRNGPQAIDYPVMPLECLWSTVDGAAFATWRTRSFPLDGDDLCSPITSLPS